MTTVKFWQNEKLMQSFCIPAGEMIIRPTKGDYYFFAGKSYVVSYTALQHTIIRDFVDHQINVYLTLCPGNDLLKHSFKVFEKESKKIRKTAKQAERLD